MTRSRDLSNIGPGYQTMFRNKVINGDMKVWQRGTSVAIPASQTAILSYSADRWDTLPGANQALTVSRQATGDTTNLPDIQYCARYQRNSGQTGVTALSFAQAFETINSIPLAGKSVSISFWARKGADYSAASSLLTVFVQTGTGTDQSPLTTFTGQASVISQNVTLTSTWQKFTYTGTIATSATQVKLGFTWTPVGTALTNDYFEVTGVQLELGSVVTPFESRPYGLELSLCQRYYYRYTNTLASSQVIGNGWCTGTTSALVQIRYPVTMRTNPTALEATGTAANYGVFNTAGSGVNASVVPAHNTNTSNEYGMVLVTVASGLTAASGTAAFINASTNAYFGWNGEL